MTDELNFKLVVIRDHCNWLTAVVGPLPTTTTTTNFIENWKITNYITFPPANSL